MITIDQVMIASETLILKSITVFLKSITLFITYHKDLSMFYGITMVSFHKQEFSSY